MKGAGRAQFAKGGSPGRNRHGRDYPMGFCGNTTDNIRSARATDRASRWAARRGSLWSMLWSMWITPLLLQVSTPAI